MIKRFILLAIMTGVLLSLSAQDQSNNSTAQPANTLDSLIQKAAFNINRNSNLSLEYARKALQLSTPSSLDRSKAFYYVGYAYYIRNNYDSARYFLNQALSTNSIHNTTWEALALNRLGNTYQLMGSYDKALGNYQEALELNRQLEDEEEIARSFTNIGNIYRTFGNFDKAIQFNLDALDIYESLEEKEGIAWTCLNIARLFKLNESYKKAFEYLDKAYAIYKQIATEEGVKTGETLCLKEYGLIHAKAGNLDKALEYSNTVLERNKAKKNQYGVANTLANIGKIYYQKNNYSQSLDYLQRSLALKQKLNDKLELPGLLRLIGENFLKTGKDQMALQYFKRSLEEARNQQLKSELKETYKSLSDFYKISDNEDKALHYFTLYSNLKDTLANQHINELEMQYEFEKQQEKLKFEQQQQRAIQEARLKRQKILTWSFIVGFVLVVLLLFVIFRSYRRKIETNKQLALQKEEIETQRDEIEAQRDMATRQRDQIARQNQVITESIEYARRIQNAVLPQQNSISNLFRDYLIFYKPKNIVSGDFYWISRVDGKTVVAAADCTGHGVPGAFMSMLGVAFLNEIVNQSKVLSPDEILNQLRKNVIDALHQTIKKRGSRDGMDIALSVIDNQNNMLYYAGAYNPAYVIREKELHEIKADRMPIGVHAVYQDTSFSVKTFQLQQGDKLYLFSDGFYDQFGGEKGLKFGRKAFKEMLLSIHEEPMQQQRNLLENRLEEWMGSWTQIDDIMIVGIHYDQANGKDAQG